MPFTKRLARVSVGTANQLGREWASPMRIQFDVSRDGEREPNRGTVSITNLSRDSRSFLENDDLVLKLEAGIDSELLIFLGDVVHVEHQREPPEWVSRIEIEDGGRAFVDTEVAIFGEPAVSQLVLIQQLTAQMGLPVEFRGGSELRTEPYPHGYSFQGQAIDFLSELCDEAGLEWSIQDNAIVVLPLEGQLSEVSALISPETGLIGHPVRTHVDADGKRRRRRRNGSSDERGQRNGVRFQVLLNLTLVPGQQVELDSQEVSGIFTVRTVVYRGDTYGRDWLCEVTATERG